MIDYLTNSLCRDLSLVILPLEMRSGEGVSHAWLRRPSGQAAFVLDVFAIGGAIELVVQLDVSDDALEWTTVASLTAREAGHQRVEFPLSGFVCARYSIAPIAGAVARARFQLVGSIS